MKHLIFSKQCDHDLDLVPFWYDYYTRVYRADLIVLTPVKTPLSDIGGICEFYRARGHEVVPIEVERWDDETIWRCQLEIVRPHVERWGREFTALSADTDQFFQPLDEHLTAPDVVFRRHFVYADGAPQVGKLEQLRASVDPTYDLVAGFVGTLDNPRVGLTGHFHGLTLRTTVRRELHFAFRGSKQFKEKVRSLAVIQDQKPDAQHWKRWKLAAESDGDDGLNDVIRSFTPPERDLSNQGILKDFADVVGGRIDGRALRSPCAFGSQLLNNLFEVATLSGARSFSLTYPLGDLERMKELFSSGCYLLPEGIVPNCVIDIGAHIGVFTALMKLQNADAEIACFEGNPDTAALLGSNFGSDSRVRINVTAVSDSIGEAAWFVDPLSAWDDSLEDRQPRVRAQHNVPTVDAADLDQLFPGLPIDVLKLSVNGMESRVLNRIDALSRRVKCLILTAHRSHAAEVIETAAHHFALQRRTPIGKNEVLVFAAKAG